MYQVLPSVGVVVSAVGAVRQKNELTQVEFSLRVVLDPKF